MPRPKKKEIQEAEVKEKSVLEKKPKKSEPIFWQATKNDKVISWQAPEYQYLPKGESWGWISLILAIILIALALWNKNFLFAVFIFVAELILIYFSGKYPSIWKFELGDDVLKIGETKKYKLEQFSVFDIREALGTSDADREYKELIFRFKSKLSPDLKILVFREDEKMIENKLLKYLEREKIEASLADIVEKIFRF